MSDIAKIGRVDSPDNSVLWLAEKLDEVQPEGVVIVLFTEESFQVNAFGGIGVTDLALLGAHCTVQAGKAVDQNEQETEEEDE